MDRCRIELIKTEKERFKETLKIFDEDFYSRLRILKSKLEFIENSKLKSIQYLRVIFTPHINEIYSEKHDEETKLKLINELIAYISEFTLKIFEDIEISVKENDK